MIWSGYSPQTLLPVVGVIALVLIVLYLLRVRRRTVEVAYLGVWKQILRSAPKRRWTEILRRLVSFLLWMIIVGLIALALMDPRPEAEDEPGRHAVILIDTSASMMATQPDSTCGRRLDCVLLEAQRLIDAMRPGDRVVLVEAAGHVGSISGPFSGDREALGRVLGDVSARAASDDVGKAFELAKSLLREQDLPEIHLLTDGQFAPDAIDLDTLPLEVSFVSHIVGAPAGNLSITRFNARRYIANRMGFEVFVEVHNGFDQPVTLDLEIWGLGEDAFRLTEGGDKTLIDRKRLTLASESAEVRVYENLPLSSGRIAARIRMVNPSDLQDIMPEDDVAYAYIPDFARPRIACVTSGNLFLEAALLLNENYSVRFIRPDAPEIMVDGQVSLSALASQYDIVILDNSHHALVSVHMDEDWAGRAVFINPTPAYSPFPSKWVRNPIVERVNARHSIARWLSLRNLNISQAYVFSGVSQNDVVLRAIEGALIATRKREHQRLVAIGFSLVESDLIFRVALPVLIINIVDWLMDESTQPLLGYSTGEAWHVSVSPGMVRGRLKSPSGRVREGLVAYAGVMTAYGDEAGFYELSDAADPTRVVTFAANFGNARESDLMRPVIRLESPLHRPSTWHETEPEEGGAFLAFLSRLPRSAQHIWVLACLLVALALFLEWLTYHRRWTV